MIFLINKNLSVSTISSNYPELEIEGQQAHHVINVLRSKVGDQVCILNGMGDKFICEISKFSKAKFSLKIKLHQKEKNRNWPAVAIPICKKENLDLLIKESTELGVSQIIFYGSDYAKNKALDISRVNRLIESAIEQSGNPHFPLITNVLKIEDLIKIEGFTNIFIPNSQVKNDYLLGLKPLEKKIEALNTLLVIGPEGGFSPREVEFLDGAANVKQWHEPSPVLRSTTALPYFYGRLMTLFVAEKKL